MDNTKIIARFNRGIKLGMHRLPLLIAFLALVASGVSYQLVLTSRYLLQDYWHYAALHGSALALAMFWIFLGLALNARYYFGVTQHQRVTVALLTRSFALVIRHGIVFCSTFIIGALLGWLGLLLKMELMQLPYVGVGASILFAWWPFILFLLLKLLPFVIAAILYLLVPIISLKGVTLNGALVRVLSLWRSRPIESILCTLSGLLPLILALWLVGSLQHHTMIYLGSEDPAWVVMLRRLVLAFASAAVLAPAMALLGAWGFESAQWLSSKTE